MWHCVRAKNQEEPIAAGFGVNPCHCFCLTAQVRARECSQGASRYGRAVGVVRHGFPSFRKLGSTELQGWLLHGSASLSFSSAISKKRLWCTLILLSGASRTFISDGSPLLQPHETLGTRFHQKICSQGFRRRQQSPWQCILDENTVL